MGMRFGIREIKTIRALMNKSAIIIEMAMTASNNESIKVIDEVTRRTNEFDRSSSNAYVISFLPGIFVQRDASLYPLKHAFQGL